MFREPGLGRGAGWRELVVPARCGGSVPAGMFRKARRVNVRKRNDSEEEDEERDEEPPQEPAPAAGVGGEGPGEASMALAAGSGLLPLPAGCVPLALPGSPAAFACAASYGAALGLGLGLMGADRASLGALPAPALLPPPPPPPPQQGNGLPGAGRPKEKKRPRENREVPRASLLSFQDEEEETEEVFKVKKSSYSKKIVKQLKKEYKEDLEKSKIRTEVNSPTDVEPALDKTGQIKDIGQEDGTANSEHGEEEMEVESEKEEEKPKAAGAFSSALSSLNVLRPGEIPDAAFIHAARKKRQMARELGDFTPVESEPGKGRLVREDENDASDDEDDDEKRRIVFTVKEKSQRQKIAEEIGIEGSDDEALVAGEQDEELSRWEQEQIRKGINIPQVQPSQPAEVNNLYYQNTYQTLSYGSSYGIPYTYAAYGSSENKSQKTDNTVPFKTPSNEMTPVTIDLVKKQLKDRLDSMKDLHKANRQQYEKHQQSREDSTKAIERLEGSSGGIGEQYKFLQEMRGYVQDLLECFSEKVFRPYAKQWLGPLLQLVVSGNNGGDGIHYMVVEIVVTILSWTSVTTPKGSIKDEILANRLLEFLMKNAFHQKRAVFRHNLEIIKTVIECWKNCLSIPYSLIFEKFSSGDPDTKDNSVGIQLLGIVLANNLPPFDLKCEIDRGRYFQALISNMGLLKYKEVYAAAAEVLGLALQYIAGRGNVLEDPVYDCVIRQLKHHQNTQQDKFIQCLNKVVKNFPPLADRFMNAVFFLIPKLHGVMKTYCLEVIMCRAEEIPDLHLQLKSKDFIQIMNHRDDERQRVCLDIVYKMLSKLKPPELKELLPGVTGFISHPSVICRQRMYDILMWIYDNYSDPESQADGDSQEILKLAKEMLLQGLIDENAELQLIVRNFWSDETRLPTNILDRMLSLLNSLYSTKIETQYLSLITNFLLEMTSKSPDYSRKIFEHPLSECKFQDFVIDASWRYQSTMLTPLFVEIQASQSMHRNLSQDRSLSASGSIGGRVRATQRQYEFTPTQHSGGRSSFNWLTGSSIDTLADYTVPSSSESLSSSMLLVNKRSEKFKQATFKPVGPDFGKKRLGLPGDEADNKAKGIEERAEILRLRRRFLKDQEKLSLFYAKKGVAEQRREKEIKTELKIKHDAQVTLYRSYRVGDLPDIQIEYCSLIAPLQALAQKDPTFAKQLFSSLFGGIFHEVEKSKTPSEKRAIIQKLLNDFNNFLSLSLSYFPPFIACIQEMSYQHKELLELDSANVSTSCLASLQQPVGILLLEHALMALTPAEEPPSKRMRGRTELPPDVIRWIELAKLYRSLGDYDVLRGIFSGKIGTKEITRKALLAEARSDYAEATKCYDEALSKEDWQDGEPTEAEKDFWELASLECYDHLTDWKSLEYCATVNIDSGKPPDLSKTWNDPFFQETYLPYIIRSKMKLLLSGENDQTLLTFIDEAMKTEQRKAIIEMHYSQELSLLYILQDDFDRAKYYISNGMQIFMQSYSSIDTLLYQSRMTKLQSVQALTEIQDFVNFMTKRSNLASQASLKRLLRTWTSRYPDARLDPMNIWDDIITNRCFFLDKLQEKLLCDPANDSMEVDEDNAGDQMEVDQQGEDIYSMIKSCKFNMKMKMVESARKQNSFSVAEKLLKDLRKEAKTREDWLVRWNYAYCRFVQSRSQNQSCPERIRSVLKTISLLEDTKSDYPSKNVMAFRNQNLLLGTTYRIMANALSQDPRCLEQITEEKAGKIPVLSGESLESREKVLAALNKKAFQCLSSAARKSEEEVQSRSLEHVDVMGVVDAYMTVVGFCDQHLRREEEGLLEINTADLQLFPAVVVENMIKALKLNSREARLRFPRLLQIIERYPAETLGLVTRELFSVPCWQFIGWISQMMALLDKDEAVAVQRTVEEIANTYPQALVYPFMISSESYRFKDTATGCKNKEFVERIKNKLDRGGVVQDFVRSLDQLSSPIMLFKDWIEDVRNELVKAQRSRNKLKEMYEGMYKNLGDLEAPGLGLLRKRFIQAFGKDFDHHFGKSGSKLLDMKASDFDAITSSLVSKMIKTHKEPGNLRECSPWMSEFKAEFLRNELEVPGQYDGKGKPLPEYHAKISGFDERISVMESLRKPKRITIRGSDEQEYPFLVKGGEDLRQDQRIEQLFDVMNIILSQNAMCSQRNMQLKTYQVIPMTTRLGLIKWLENTCTLKEFLKNSMSEEEDFSYNSNKGPRATYSEWLSRMSGKAQGIYRYQAMYRKASRTETVMSFKSRESSVPEDLLRRAFVKMSTSPEAFLSLRSHFASSHALMCISHWVLGIGDRHLSNFMINKETGGMVGIDFGHAFGSATQFLPVPELMPFRLTRQFVNLMMPVKEWGLIYSVMVHALRAYRADPDLLISTMDVFVKEPSLDWKNFEQRQLKKGGTWMKEINTSEVNWYPLQKVHYVKRKLTGANPATITCDELRLGFEKSPSYHDFAAVARGHADHNIRAKEPEDGLSEETQVRCLIDQATDPNVLGRTWEGWEPWM